MPTATTIEDRDHDDIRYGEIEFNDLLRICLMAFGEMDTEQKAFALAVLADFPSKLN